MNNRFAALLITLIVLILLVGSGVLLYIRELRRAERHAYYQEIANQQKEEISITIPEGYRREQIAVLLEEKGVTSAEDFLQVTSDDEGHLFPDTYRFFPASTAREVRDRLVQNYTAKISALGNIDNPTLIIASIVEREAVKDSDRPKIAGVYFNRYKTGFNLGADPTVQYGKDTNELAQKQKVAGSETARHDVLLGFNFWSPITRSDYTGVDSPYNTYRTSSLPPTPIANPGLASLSAALHPESHDYFYFFHTESGETYYSKTLQEHNLNKSKYL